MGKKHAILLVIFTLLLTSCAGKPASATAAVDESTSASTPASSSSSPSSTNTDLGGALNLVMGSDSQPSVFPSYHIDVTLVTPSLSTDQASVTIDTTQISADVAGSDVHILQTDPGATQQKEGYIIGEKEYKMVDGAPQEMNGQIGLSWAMWPLNVVMVYSYPVYFAKKTGSESIDGRPADVYSFDTNDTSAVSDAAMSAMGMGNLTTGKGKVWIDQATGGMLKLDMTYSTKVQDYDQKVVGSGDGSIKLEVSKVGQATVTSPVQ